MASQCLNDTKVREANGSTYPSDIVDTPPRTSVINGIEYTRLPVANYTPSWGRQPDPKSRCWNNQLVTSTVKNNIGVTITNNYTGGLTESSFKQGGWELTTDAPLSCDDSVVISANKQPGPTTYGIAPNFEFELGNITEMSKVCDVVLPGGIRPPIGSIGGGFVLIGSNDITINLKKGFQRATITATNLVNFLNSNSTTTQYNGADFTMSLQENKIDKWWRWTENCAVINISEGLKAVSLSKKYSQWLQLTTNNNGPDLPVNPEMDTVYVSYSTTTGLRNCTVELSSPLPFNWKMTFEETRPTTSYPMYPIKAFEVTLSAGSTEMTVYPQTSGYTTVGPALILASYLPQYKCDNKRWIIYESKSSSNAKGY